MMQKFNSVINNRSELKHCKHCNLEVPENSIHTDFCCQGCKSVFEIITEYGLDDFYQIKEESYLFNDPKRVQKFKYDFSYLDSSPQIQQEQSARTLEFYIEGIHCSACLWLIEKLPEILPFVMSCQLRLNDSIAKITISQEGSFKKVAETLVSLGYKPHAIKDNLHQSELSRKENHMTLIQIGVAAFSTGNLMILAVSLYSGLTGSLAQYFDWLMLFLALPTLTFSAAPFYKKAWYQLKFRTISIELPIAISLLVGSLVSFYSVLFGYHFVYFDSLSTLVFLLLISRYLLKRTQDSFKSQYSLLDLYDGQEVLKFDPDSQDYKKVLIDELHVGDKVKVLSGEKIPVDGEICSGHTSIDKSLLTGEAYPEKVNCGEQVFCGTINIGSEIIVKANEIGQKTRLGNILKETQENLNQKSLIISLSNTFARIFVSCILILSIMVFIFTVPLSLEEAISRALSVIIISCPCAIALTIPLLLTQALHQAIQKGFIIKSTDVFEQLIQIKNIIFDKTGTLTEGRFQVLSISTLSPEAKQALVSLESQSNHPIAHAVKTHFNSEVEPCSVKDFHILPQGIKGTIKGSSWEVIPFENHSNEDMNQPLTQLILKKDGNPQGYLTLGDKIRFESNQTIEKLSNQGLEIHLLSGDQESTCKHVARKLNIQEENVFFQHSPEEKQRVTSQFQQVAMIGDGANDMMALSTANIGISIGGCLKEGSQVADIHFIESNLNLLPELFKHAHKTVRLIKVSIVFSLFYNLIGVTAAMLGWVTPLFAAILMPLSSITVLLGALIGGKK